LSFEKVTLFQKKEQEAPVLFEQMNVKFEGKFDDSKMVYNRYKDLELDITNVLFINKEANDSINTIGIDVSDATVNLSLSKKENTIYDDWFFSINPIDIKEVVFEKLGNLYITTKTKQLNL
jgi:hypothetical protein